MILPPAPRRPLPSLLVKKFGERVFKFLKNAIILHDFSCDFCSVILRNFGCSTMMTPPFHIFPVKFITTCDSAEIKICQSGHFCPPKFLIYFDYYENRFVVIVTLYHVTSYCNKVVFGSSILSLEVVRSVGFCNISSNFNITRNSGSVIR